MTSLEERVTSIEERLTSLEERVTSIEERMTSLEERVTPIEERLTLLEERVTAIKYEVIENRRHIREVKLTLENETNRNIKLVAEGHYDLNKKLNEANKWERERELFMVRINSMENKINQIFNNPEPILAAEG